MFFEIRLATLRDVPFLREMLYEAVCWRADQVRETFEVALSNPEIARYADEWGRSGDLAVIADNEQGRPIGAAWYRLFTRKDPGYGFISESVPEAGIAVSAPLRGRGVGRGLLTALTDQARTSGHPGLSLSVEEDNPAARLYESFGFVTVGRFGNAQTMWLDLA